MRVRLIKKFADAIDGIDLSNRTVGKSFQLDPRDARLLVAEGWAVPVGTGKSSLGRGKHSADDRRSPGETEPRTKIDS